MKIIRAPLRISLFGGGTDLAPYCEQYGSTIISFAINRHIYLTWNDRPTGGCHLSYSEVEETGSLIDAKHDLVREAAQRYGIPEPCTLTIVSDLPKGTGLGSSSALAVCLVKLTHPKPGNDLVRLAGQIEHAHSKAGWQDYLPAVWGGFNAYHIWADPAAPSGLRSLDASALSVAAREIVNRYGLLLYTGAARKADDVLPSWQASTSQLHEIKILADAIVECIGKITPESLGQYLDLTWNLKRGIGSVSSSKFDAQYDIARDAGALGGKLCGAGAGGCWFFLVPPERRQHVKDALPLREITFQIAEKGVETWEL